MDPENTSPPKTLYYTADDGWELFLAGLSRGNDGMINTGIRMMARSCRVLQGMGH